MNAASTIDNFTWLEALGYGPRLIPIIPPNAPLFDPSSPARSLAAGKDVRGKAPGLKRADGLWWGFPSWTQCEAERRDLERWARWGANAGLKTGGGLYAIDVDALDPTIASQVRDDLQAWAPDLPMRVGRAPKALYPIRCDEPCPYMRVEFGLPDERGNRQRIEILSTGKQFVAAGGHPAGRSYQWRIPLCPFDELPVLTVAGVEAFMERLRGWLPQAGPLDKNAEDRREIPQETLRGSLDEIRSAIAHVKNEGERFSSRESYRDVGYAIKAAVGEAGLEVFQDWCATWADGDNDPEIVADDWARMKAPFRRGASWIYEIAEDVSGGQYKAVARWHEEPPEEIESIFGRPEDNESATAAIRATPFDFGVTPRPRQWVYGRHYVRQFLSATIAPSKVGKTALIVAEALAMVSGKPLLGVQVKAPRRVWLWNGEDPLEEMQRRVLACMRLHGLTPEDVGDRLFLDSGRHMPIVLAAMERHGAKIAQPVREGVIAELQKNRIDMLSIDPFVSSHKISENDNVAMDLVAKSWAQIADAAACSVDLTHHTRKLGGGATEATIQDSRGASALIAAVRSSRALAKMGKEEAEKSGMEDGWRRLFRLSDVDMSMALPDPHTENWFELASVDLLNGNDDEPMGDNVGAVRMWAASQAPVEQAVEAQQRALELIAANDWKRNVRANDGWVGCAIAQAFQIDRGTEAGKREISKILERMFKEKILKEETGVDAQRKRKQFVRVVDRLDLFSDV